MGFHIGLGALLLITTTAVHAGAMVLALRGIKITHASRWGDRSALTRVGLISFLVVIMFLASFIESGIWALTYLGLGALSGLEEALYFSMVTFTTLGYGDVTLSDQWRLLSSFEAANGTIMFGWTTALIVAAVHKLYLRVDPDADQPGG
jgi:hypothetical protein